MRIRHSLSVTAGVIALSCLSAAAREWTDATGRHHIEADYAGYTDGKVELKGADRKTWIVPLGRLSEADQRYVTKRLATQAPAPPTASKPEKTPQTKQAVLAARKRREQEGRLGASRAKSDQAKERYVARFEKLLILAMQRGPTPKPVLTPEEEETMHGQRVVNWMDDLFKKGRLEPSNIREYLAKVGPKTERAKSSAESFVSEYGDMILSSGVTARWIWKEAMIRLEEGDLDAPR